METFREVDRLEMSFKAGDELLSAEIDCTTTQLVAIQELMSMIWFMRNETRIKGLYRDESKRLRETRF